MRPLTEDFLRVRNFRSHLGEVLDEQIKTEAQRIFIAPGTSIDATFPNLIRLAYRTLYEKPE